MSVRQRLSDAEFLRDHGRLEGALLSALIATAGLARQEYPTLGDGAAFRSLLRTFHEWTIEVEHRGQLVDSDQLFYKWLRCELAHTGALPFDVGFDESFAEPASLSIRAGGGADGVVLLTPGWLDWLIGKCRERLPVA